MEDRISREHQELVVDHYQSGTALVAEATEMTIRDFVVRCDTSTAAFTLTLPPVVPAKGKIYTVKLIRGAEDGGATHDLTITTQGTAPYKDAMRWHGAFVLDRHGESAVFFSDGEEWHILAQNRGKPTIFKKHIHEKFEYPMTYGSKGGNGVPSGTGGDENVIHCGSGNFFEYHILGTQDILAPDWADPGLNVGGMDQTANDGIEVCGGIGAGAPIQFTVGTDPAFFCRCKFNIADVSGTDDCAFGFRKREAYQANIDDYDEMSCLNVISGNVTCEAILNDGATDSDDTGDDWGDGETHILEVRVSATGVVTNFFDDVAVNTTPTAFTFDNGEVVIPFFYFLFDTTSPGDIIIYEWEAGYQS